MVYGVLKLSKRFHCVFKLSFLLQNSSSLKQFRYRTLFIWYNYSLLRSSENLKWRKTYYTYLSFDQILSTNLLILKFFKLNVNKNHKIFLLKWYYFKFKMRSGRIEKVLIVYNIHIRVLFGSYGLICSWLQQWTYNTHTKYTYIHITYICT